MRSLRRLLDPRLASNSASIDASKSLNYVSLNSDDIPLRPTVIEASTTLLNLNVGVDDGFQEGAELGTFDGCVLGSVEGFRDGSMLGAEEGFKEGLSDGSRLGFKDGCWLGALDG